MMRSGRAGTAEAGLSAGAETRGPVRRASALAPGPCGPKPVLVMASAVLLLALAGAAAAAEVPYVHAPAYNTFPWWFKLKASLFFTVVPLAQPPTPPPAYAAANYPQIGRWDGGPGFMLLLRYAESPIDDYSELIFIPGHYSPLGCSGGQRQYKAVQRIWVDSVDSRRAGRNIWGFPKEIASFEWSEDAAGTTVGVTVRDPATGKAFFQASFADAPLPRIFTEKISYAYRALGLPETIPILFWPIDDNRGDAELSAVPAYQTARAAAAASPPQRIVTALGFEARLSKVVVLRSQFVDPVTFTGRADQAVKLLPAAARLPPGAVVSTAAPVALKCA